MSEHERSRTQDERGGKQESPIELLAPFLARDRRRLPPGRADNARGDVAIRLAPELEIFPSTGARDIAQRAPIEHGLDPAEAAAASRRFGNETAGGRADADHVYRHIGVSCGRERGRHAPAPRLAVGDDDERLRVGGFAEELLIGLDEAQPPVHRLFDVGVPGRIVFETKRRLLRKPVEKKEERVGIFREAQLRRREVGKQRQADPVLAPVECLCKRPEKPHGPLPAIWDHIPDVHRRGAVLKNDEIGAGNAWHPHTRLRPRQSQDAEAHRGEQAQPERQITDRGVPLAYRNYPQARVAPGVRATPQQLHGPQHDQHAGHREQPQVHRLGEAERADIESKPHYWRVRTDWVLVTTGLRACAAGRDNGGAR